LADFLAAPGKIQKHENKFVKITKQSP